MHAPIGKVRISQVGPDRKRQMSSDSYSKKNEANTNESKGFSKDMPGGGLRISQGSFGRSSGSNSNRSSRRSSKRMSY